MRHNDRFSRSRLKKAELVTREELQEDRRVFVVQITPKGEQLMESLLPEHYRRVAELMSSLNERDRKSLPTVIMVFSTQTILCQAALASLLGGLVLIRPAHAEVSNRIIVSQAEASDGASSSAQTLLKRGAIEFERRNWQAAEVSWQQALKLYREAGDRENEGRILGNLAAIQVELGHYPQAIALFQQSLTIAQERQDQRGKIFALTNLAFVYSNQGDYTNAATSLNLALSIAQASRDQLSECYILNQLGIIQRATGNYDQAIALLQKSVTLARKLNNPSEEANGLGNLANTYVEQGNYAAAVANYQTALPLMRQVKNRVGEAGVLQRLGSFYAEIGNLSRAVDYFNQSLAIAREIGDRRLQAYNLANLGRVAYNNNDPKTALTNLEQALSIMKQLGDQAAVASLYNTLGNAYSVRPDYKAARTAFQNSLKLAQTLKLSGTEGIALASLASLTESEGLLPASIPLYQQAIAKLRQAGDRPRLGTALSNLGMAQAELKDLNAAETSLLEAIAIWESLRPGLSDIDQISLFETQAATYRALQRVQIQLNRYNQALETAERGRARAFVELVARRYSVQVAQRLTTSPPTIADIQEIARQQRATLVQYSILDNTQLGIWVIQPNGTIHFRQTTLPQEQNSLAEMVEQTRFAAVLGRGVKKNNARPNVRLHKLYQVLIAPIASLLPKTPKAEVVFIPQGSLFLIPFAALQDANSTFLIEHYAIRTAPAIQVLQLTHQRRSQLQSLAKTTSNAPSALIVGNPVMPAIGNPPEALSPLPYAEVEATQIAQLLNTRAIVGHAATESAVTRQMPMSRFVHLATHGLLDDLGGVGIPGALAFAPTSNSDGFLTSNEILTLSLPATSLVVLSACDTGQGKITGDGVVGLSRSFFLAGVPSVVVSLWAVPDDSTALLMTTFYQQLQRTSNKAQALRQAMLSTMKQFPGSRDWAAFTLVGEAE